MRKYILIALSFLFVAAAPLMAPSAEASELAESEWIVSADKAKILIEADAATVLDTRGGSWKLGHVPGAQSVDWKDFSQSDDHNKGKLLDDRKALTKKLRELGISKGKPVLVVGKPPNNWGEDGRIVWMLRALGHPKVALVNGGHKALRNAGVKSVIGGREVPTGDFTPAKSPKLSINRDGLKEHYASDDYVVLDTREKREFDGETPYGESRGGHVPGAEHIHYADLLRSDGRLLPKAKIKKKLEALGVTPDKKVVAYCTGGVRSAWLVVVLAHLGYDDVANYPGSMWDWAAAPADEYPLDARE